MSKKMCKCKACQQEIAKSAKVCPHCGAKNKKVNLLLIGIILVALVAVIATAGGTDETENKTFSVGETATLKDVQVRLVDVTESTGSAYNKPSDGNVFVLCEFEIVNNSKEEVVVSSLVSFDAYCDDYACSLSFSALLEIGDKSQLDGTVAAGKKLSGVIGYEVPANWKELEIHFEPDVWSGKDIVFIATND